MSKDPVAKAKAKGKGTQSEDFQKSDQKAIEAFCKSVDYDEITIEQWKAVNASKCLIIPVFISEEQASTGTSKELVFSRTRRRLDEMLKQKEKVKYLLDLPQGVQDGFEVLVADLGDIDGHEVGTVRFIVKISRKNLK